MMMVMVLALLAAWLSGCGTRAAAKRPNILYIMADDHAAHALSCYGSRVNTTPHLDQLANEGVRFTNAFCTNAICTPARATLLTGQYSHMNQVRDNSGVLPANTVHFAQALGANGYQTAIIGKWHLNRLPTGFDHWDILPGQGEYVNPEFITSSGKQRIAGYVTDITIDKSIDWISHRDQSRPFLLLCHLKAPHRSWVPEEPYASQWRSRDVPLPATFNDDYATRSGAAQRQTMTVERHLTPTDLKFEPPAGLSAEELKVWKYQRYMQDYLACVQSVDDNVGRLMEYLKANDLADDTVVVYTSDQGFFLGDHGWYDKRFMYEPSLRSPLIVRYPREIAAGTTSDAMALGIDYAPTFMDYAGVPVSTLPHEVQGESLRPALRGKTPREWRTSMYYHYYEAGEPHTVAAHYGVRTQRYKLIRFYGAVDAWEFYDLKEDPDELRNRYDDPACAATIAQLKETLVQLQQRYKDERPEAR